MIKFRDPCKKCLIKACCNIECINRENYKRFIKSLSIVFFLLSIVTMYNIVSLSLHFNMGFILIPLWIIPFIIIMKEVEEPIIFSFDNILFFIFSPFLYITICFIKLYKFIFKVKLGRA